MDVCLTVDLTPWSGCVDVAVVAFQLDFGDAVEGHAHLVEPGGDDFPGGSFHDTDDFAFSEIDEAAMAPDGGIMLRGGGELIDLFGGELAGGKRVSAHKFCHGIAFLFFWFGLFWSRGTELFIAREPLRLSLEILPCVMQCQSKMNHRGAEGRIS